MIEPGATIGILGGGQLGRMTALAAASLGYRTHVFCPEPDSPGKQVTSHVTTAAYDDRAALRCFAETVDVVTFEFENVPADTAEILADLKPVRPAPAILRIAQDRLREKEFLRFVLSREGQQIVADSRIFIPLDKAQLEAELRKLD